MSRQMIKIWTLFLTSIALFLLSSCNQSTSITLKFDSNGGTLIADITLDEKTEITLPENPTRDHYEFLGWFFDDVTFEQSVSIESISIQIAQEISELIVYAKWSPIDYPIHYVLYDGVNHPDNPLVYNAETQPTIVNPTKEGYTFEGWYLDGNFSTLLNTSALSYGEMTLHAKWSLATYILKFVDEFGVTIQSFEYEYGADLSSLELPTPSKIGYTFIEWDTQIPTSMPASDVTITARYSINQYTVTFDTQGGSFIASISQEFNSVFSKPADPIKEGYSFGGWYRDLNDTTPYSFTVIHPENITLFAKWNINSYTVNFVNDGKIIQTSNHIYQSPLHITVPTPPSEKIGHTFLGWSDELPVIMPASDVFIHALYRVNSYTITFNPHDGSSNIESVFEYDALIIIPIIQRDGYTLEGWYRDEALTVRHDITNMPAEDLMLHAKWQLKTYTITYHLNGGINHDDNITHFTAETGNYIYKSPSKIGHTFVGWYQTADFSGEKVLFFILGTSEDIELHAKWSVNAYDIKYYIDEAYDPTSSITLYPNEVIVSISSGGDFSLALSSIGRLFAWGRNNHGQLGDGTSIDQLKPKDITRQFTLSNDEKIVSISTGYSHAAILTDAGRIYTWGLNTFGQLGDGTVVSKNAPIDISSKFILTAGETLNHLFLGGDYSAVITSSNRVLIFGRNNYGQLGDGTIINRNIPTDISSRFTLATGETIVTLSMGGDHISALSSLGNVFLWGRNNYGQLGDGTNANKNKPTNIRNILSLQSGELIQSIELGGNHSSVVTSLGRLLMWGWNAYGQLGDSTIANKNRPTDITTRFALSVGEKVIISSLGDGHSIAKTSLGRILTWGQNTSGQLGDDTIIQRNTPVDITSAFDFDALTQVELLSLGANHALALSSSGQMMSFGNNQYGQIGKGTVLEQRIPYSIKMNYPTLVMTETYDYEASIETYKPTQIGYSLSDWYIDFGMSSPYTSTTMTNEEVILIAFWSAVIYTISYDLNGGVENILNPINYTIETETITIEPILKEGYQFLGWYSNSNFSGEPTTTITEGSTGDISLYAKWSVNQYTVSFEENGGSLVNDITADFGVPLTSPANPIREGYTFGGWYIDTSFTTSYIFKTIEAQDLTLYAKWNPTLNVVTLVLNNGNDHLVIAGYSGSALLTPTYTGFAFGGWYQDQSLTIRYESSTFPTTNRTLYAKWHIAYDITYHLNGGINSIDNPSQYTGIGNHIQLSDPTQEGYTFLGWYEQIDFQGDPVSLIAQGTTGHLVFYAKWVINTYTISYYTYEDNHFESTIMLYPSEYIEYVHLGVSHSAVLTSRGRIFTWGNNASGQLGNGTLIHQSVPLEITHRFHLGEGEFIKRIYLGANHSTAFTSLGRVFTWGNNAFGQLGDGTVVQQTVPMDITSRFPLASGEAIEAIYLGANHSAAISSTGRIFTWGSNTSGQLGDGTLIHKSTPIDITNRFGIDSDDQVSILSLGTNHSSLLSASGRLFTWGDNGSGRLGDGTTTSKLVPTEISERFNLTESEKIVNISMGGNHASALTSSGRLFMWGSNTSGQLGDGTITSRSLPTEITHHFQMALNEHITGVSLGMNHSAAISSLGRMFIWGHNGSGQLGDGTLIQKSYPIDITSQFGLAFNEKIVSLSLGATHSSAVSSGSKLWTWGDNGSGRLGDGTTINKTTPVEVKSQEPDLVLTQSYDYGIDIIPYAPIQEGSTFSGWSLTIDMSTGYEFETMPARHLVLYAKWETNAYDMKFQIFEDYQSLATITMHANETIIQISSGDLHAAALTSLGRVFSWGSNTYGQLGDGTTVDRLKPVDVTPYFNLNGNEKIIGISLGAYHSSAVTSTGRLFTWGTNGYGQLGDGTTMTKTLPMEITNQFGLTVDEKIKEVSLGANHSSALTSDGRLFVWGWNMYGQLGDGTLVNRLTPQEITHQMNLASNEKITSTALGANHSSALTSHGRLLTWGWNIYGQLGNGTIIDQLNPQDITSQLTLEVGETIHSIYMGDVHSSSLTTTGRVFTWGNNSFGQIGDGTQTLRNTPTEITSKFTLASNEKIISLSLGYVHTSALTSLGKVFVWGDNSYGQLGDGTTVIKQTPLNITNRFTFSTGETIKSLSLGAHYSFALTSTGRIYTWGGNSYGQLGDGTIVSKSTPTKVLTNYSTLVKTETYLYGSIVAAYLPTKTGHTWSGWFINIEMNVPYVLSTMPANDVILYGYWIKNT